MRVKLRDEGRVFVGTPKQIIQSIKQMAAFAAHLSLEDYITWCCENAATIGISVAVVGSTLDERCEALLDQMLASDFAKKVE